MELLISGFLLLWLCVDEAHYQRKKTIGKREWFLAAMIFIGLC